MKATNCYYCGMSYCSDTPEDVRAHQKLHERKQLAERVFGFIAPYSIREYIKNYAWNADTLGTDSGMIVKEKPLQGGEDLIYYAQWCRSLEACNYDLKHPTLQEYILIRKTPNSPFINMNGGSYINMKLYKEVLNK